ncbi:MAG: hypothetical protein FWC96_07190 [Oscillospiraceae bacterium]|nr:hypothetical protein [Oscillospiraceae bacterium]
MEFDLSRVLSEELLARIRKDTRMETADEFTVEMSADNEPFFIFEVRGFVPELIDGVSFRITRKINEELKVVKCPYCGVIIAKITDTAKVEVRRSSGKMQTPCTSYKKCDRCKGYIGIQFVDRSA